MQQQAEVVGADCARCGKFDAVFSDLAGGARGICEACRTPVMLKLAEEGHAKARTLVALISAVANLERLRMDVERWPDNAEASAFAGLTIRWDRGMVRPELTVRTE